MADGWLEQGYSLLDEIPPNPGRYYPREDEVEDAARFTGQTLADTYITEKAAKLADICAGCQWQGNCNYAGHPNADYWCNVARRML